MKQSNLKIAITGGIGSGKSAVAEIIAGEGYPVFSCDKIYSELLTDKQFLQEIDKNFSGVINIDGSLNRSKLSCIVFNDEAKLKKLNEITHKKILSAAFGKMGGHKISFLEVPLLFENGFETLFDQVIVVMRDKDQRINSVINRDKISSKQVDLRINQQFDYENADFAKYYVIHNCSDLVDLKRKTVEILQKIN